MPIELAENTVIAERYKLTRMIGRGGMGTVWQATNVRLDVQCAIKFIEGELAENAVALARFEREAKAAAQIRSAHVVQVLDHGTFQGWPYIAMELLDGEDLGKRLNRLGKLPPRDVAAIVTHVSRALSKAHTMDIVHRDLKPENIFLAWDDEREVAKVLDFGIAKRVQVDVPSHTTAGAMLGTPVYMSPEQAHGAKNVDYRSDLWALAVIAYRSLTGMLPFRSESLAELLVKIIVHPLPVPSQAAPDVPPGFDAWWERAASRDANRRFQSAKELASELVTALGVQPFSDGLERRVRPVPSLLDQPVTSFMPTVPVAPRLAAQRASSHPPPLVAPEEAKRGHQGASFASSPTGSPLARTFADAPISSVAKRSPGSTLVATGIALIAIGGIAAFMVSQPRGSSRASGAAARVLGEPVVPEVEEEDASPAASATPSAASSGSTHPRPAPLPRAIPHP